MKEELSRRLERNKLLKEHLELYFSMNKGKCVTIRLMKDFVNSSLGNLDMKLYTYYEIRS